MEGVRKILLGRIAHGLGLFAENRCLDLMETNIKVVETWCRICGEHVLLEVPNDYSEAVRHLYSMDDTPLEHAVTHFENGGWGVSWRFDEVLDLLFPEEHLEELFPIPAWWHEQMGELASEDEEVSIVSFSEMARHRGREFESYLGLIGRVGRL